jgi:sugar lactone lactonase YvrE
MDSSASLFYPCQCKLGEGPLWHPKRKSFFWVDIENCRLFECSWSSHKIMSWDFEEQVTAAVIDRKGHLVLGFKGGLGRFNLQTGGLEWLLDIEKDFGDHRCNDGCCDSSGRLWIGTMHRDFEPGAGSLYCIDGHLAIEKKLDQITISNGLAWSPDNSRMYYIDSPTQTVQAYLYDQYTGGIRFEKIAVQVPKSMGTPDGMAIDEEGMLWVAHWGGFGVFRWNPSNGKLISRVSVPVPNVSSCAFGGEKLNDLIITTARELLTPEELKAYPSSGDLFIFNSTLRGLPTFGCSI